MNQIDLKFIVASFKWICDLQDRGQFTDGLSTYLKNAARPFDSASQQKFIGLLRDYLVNPASKINLSSDQLAHIARIALPDTTSMRKVAGRMTQDDRLKYFPEIAKEFEKGEAFGGGGGGHAGGGGGGHMGGGHSGGPRGTTTRDVGVYSVPLGTCAPWMKCRKRKRRHRKKNENIAPVATTTANVAQFPVAIGTLAPSRQNDSDFIGGGERKKKS